MAPSGSDERLEQARGTLGDLIDRARLAGEPTMITRYGKPGAVVVSADWYQDADCLEQSADGPGRDRKACNRC
jgi:prevent-host-death family protein